MTFMEFLMVAITFLAAVPVALVATGYVAGVLGLIDLYDDAPGDESEVDE